jgi:hypothetical protein
MPGQGQSVPQVIEPPTVTYRDVTVHNPRYAGGLSVWGYSKEEIKRDCDAIVQNAGSDKKCKCFFALELFRMLTSDKTVIEILTRLGPLKMEVVAHEFPSHNSKSETLYHLVERKTTRYVECVESFFIYSYLPC